jgi:hypothetical protein
MKIVKAIKSINPNAKFTFENNDINNIQWLEGTTPISVEIILAKIAELPTAEEDRQAKENAKVSGNQKLLDLGLSQAEATAMTGYTPPVAE